MLQLLLHPEQVEQELLQQQAAQQAAAASGGGAAGAAGAAGRPISVSTDYIDAMVKAAVEPMIGEL